MAEKEILAEITYHQLYGKPADDGSTGPMLVFYNDGTYICLGNVGLAGCSPSLWKIVDGFMWVKHTYNGPDAHKWERCDNNEGSLKITQIVAGELAEYHMLIGEL